MIAPSRSHKKLIRTLLGSESIMEQSIEIADMVVVDDVYSMFKGSVVNFTKGGGGGGGNEGVEQILATDISLFCGQCKASFVSQAVGCSVCV